MSKSLDLGLLRWIAEGGRDPVVSNDELLALVEIAEGDRRFDHLAFVEALRYVGDFIEDVEVDGSTDPLTVTITRSAAGWRVAKRLYAAALAACEQNSTANSHSESE